MRGPLSSVQFSKTHNNYEAVNFYVKSHLLSLSMCVCVSRAYGCRCVVTFLPHAHGQFQKTNVANHRH